MEGDYSGKSCLELIGIIEQAEKNEKKRKDEWKRNEEGLPVSSSLVGKGDRCDIGSQAEAGRVYHVCKGHGRMVGVIKT